MAVLTLVLMPAVRLLTQNVTKVVMEPVSSILPLTLLITTLVLHYHLMVNWVSLNPEQQDAALTQLPTPKMEAVHQVQAVLYICQPIV